MALTKAELDYYTQVPSLLKGILDEMKKSNGAKQTVEEPKPAQEETDKPEAEVKAPQLVPYWDEERQAVFVPVINKFVDAKRLTEDEVTWEKGMELAKNAGKELPSQHDMFALLLFKDEINAIIEEHDGDILEGWEWASSEYDANYAGAVYFSNGGVYNNVKSYYNCVRAVAAI